jgi:hypothetical protein
MTSKGATLKNDKQRAAEFEPGKRGMTTTQGLWALIQFASAKTFIWILCVGGGVMTRFVFVAAFAALWIARPVGAQSVFDGTWKIDVNNIDWAKKPDVYLLQAGMYECKTCSPAYSIKADGLDYPVSGHPYFDTVAIKVVSDHQVDEVDKKGGKVVATLTTEISPDGKTATWSFTDSSNTNGGPAVTGKGESALVLAGPAGSHPVSGSWRIVKMENISDNAVVWSYKTMGDVIVMTSKTGQTYNARLDGTDAPMKGDPGVTSVSAKKHGKNVLQETDKRDGKVVSVFTFTVAPDGRTAKASAYDKLQDRTTVYNAVKQ